jgi:hypothetical protein
MKLVAMLACVTLTGCSTTINEMRDHPPRATYSSSHSPAAVESCLAGDLSWLGLPSVIHGETSTELAFGGAGTTALMVTLTPVGAGTSVTVRELLTYGARVRHNVESCL